MKLFIQLFFFVLFCSPVYSTPVYYEVNGNIENRGTDTNQFLVSGNMIIDDTLKLWGGGIAPEELGSYQYSYSIESYSFEIIDVAKPSQKYSFSGDKGSFYMERSHMSMGDDMWFLENGTGEWSDWIGELMCWYNDDFSAYDIFNNINVLAPVISLKFLAYLTDDPIINEMNYTDILLTRSDKVSEPVPEPLTMVTFFLGLIGLAGVYRKRNQV